jgi:agmatine deiminase
MGKKINKMSASCQEYNMPAEWQKHEACLILYPHNTGVFRSTSALAQSGTEIEAHVLLHKCAPARKEVRNVARAICKFGKEDVYLFCNSQEEADYLCQVLKKEEEREEREEREQGLLLGLVKNQIIVQVCKSDDSWCRDTGPTFVWKKEQRTLVGLDWNFNAYGGPEEGCYWPCDNDQNVAMNMVQLLSSSSSSLSSLDHEKVNIILEGGSFHTDGEGTVLTTKECLLNPNRNPHFTKEEIETILCQYLGATKVVWLPFGIFNDEDTNGHVDNIATFCRPGEVILSWTDDVQDDNYAKCKAAEDVLTTEVDAKGRTFMVHKLYVPRAMHYTSEEVNTIDNDDDNDDDDDDDDDDNDVVTKNEARYDHVGEVEACERKIGDRLAASYVNYYLANNAIILPQFGDDVYDQKAIETMQRIFPTKSIVGVYSREILLGGGNIHCITQQLPKLSK